VSYCLQYYQGSNMSESTQTEEVVWTPQMPDRRKGDRRSANRDFNPNGKTMSISNSERRAGPDRRKAVSVTITGRAMDVEEHRT